MALRAYSETKNERPNGPSFYYYRARSGMRQVGVKPDRSLPLVYSLTLAKILSDSYHPSMKPSDADSSYWQMTNPTTDVYSALGSMSNAGKLAYNRAYGKVMELAKAGSADVIALIAERAAAAEMIQDRFTQILDIANAADRKSLKGLARALRTTPSDLRRRHRKSTGFLSTPSSTFLEVNWGWLPLLQDLYNALSYLGNDLPTLTVTGGASYNRNETLSSKSGGSSMTQVIVGKFSVKIGLRMTASSVLQTELARLGLTNPGASTWELIPYSWLVDWFSSVGEVIEGWDDALILRYDRPFITRYFRGVEWYSYRNAWAEERKFTRQRVRLNRETPGRIPGPMLAYNSNPFSAKRLTIVASLLTLRLKKFEKLHKLL